MLILRADSGEKRGAALPSRRTAGRGGMSDDGIGGRIARPDRGARSITAMAAIREYEGSFGEGRSCRAILIWF